MRTRPFGRTGREVSEIGFGAWAIGSAWGPTDEAESRAALNAALDAGMTMIDTADVYGDFASHRLIAQVLAERGGARPFVATKIGRRLPRQDADLYTYETLSGYVNANLRTLETEALDLVQLHCPPTDAYYRPEIFAAMDRLQREGKLRAWGVSVEKVEEGLKALEIEGVASVQIIFNMFRQRPAETFFARAQAAGVAVIARVPLASGLLSGKFKRDTQFDASDHRQFNRHGEAFDVGETFAGVPYEAGLNAVGALRPLLPEGATMAQLALRWILMHEAITVVIPGAKTPAQARSNAQAADLPKLDDATMQAVAHIYAEQVKPHVHQRW